MDIWADATGLDGTVARWTEKVGIGTLGERKRCGDVHLGLPVVRDDTVPTEGIVDQGPGSGNGGDVAHDSPFGAASHHGLLGDSEQLARDGCKGVLVTAKALPKCTVVRLEPLCRRHGTEVFGSGVPVDVRPRLQGSVVYLEVHVSPLFKA